MTLRKIMPPLAAVLLASVLVVPVHGQTQSGPNQAEQTAAQRGAVGARALAYELYDYGVAAKDPLAVVGAAALIAKAPATEAKREKTAEGGEAGEPKQPAGPRPDLAAMLAMARSLAGNDAALRGIIDDVAAAAPKGHIRGPQFANENVKARSTDNYTMTFKGGEPAELAIKGDGSTVLTVTVADENGNHICGGDDGNKPGIVLYCSWKPRWTGPFVVKIKNNGRVSNDYRLETN